MFPFNEYAVSFIFFLGLWFGFFIIFPINFYREFDSKALFNLIPVGLFIVFFIIVVLYNRGYTISSLARLIIYGSSKRNHELYRTFKYVICTCCCGCCH